MTADLSRVIVSPFDAIRRTDEGGGEYWSARDLMPLLGYTSWDRAPEAIERGMAAANNSGASAPDHFRGASKMVDIGSGASRRISDYHLTRYGAYLLAMNCDPRKLEVAQAQTYFAVRTREAEVARREPTRLELIDMARDAELARIAAEERNAVLSGRVAQLEPAATAWTGMVDAAGDYDTRGAAQILCRAGIDTGQNRLRAELRRIAWTDRNNRPYQRHVNAGRLVERMRVWEDPETGEQHIDRQLRVTAKGMGDLIAQLGPGRPPLTVVPA